ncbi:unnamed protein product [Withania somnifera]
MSVASSSSFPCIKIQTPSSPIPSSTTSSSYNIRFSTLTIRTPTPVKPVPPSPPSSSSPPLPPTAPPKQVAMPAVESKNVITMEFQRQKAKELQEYFKQKKLEEANQGPFFGFIGKNEISNGRWAMFGFAVGMLTQYATGSDFVDQVKILLSNFGILDLE